MKNNNFAALCADIDLELKNLDRLVNELKNILPKIGSPPDSFEVRAIGSILHDFYTGIENLFKHIAVKIDGDTSSAAGWHTQLLKRMGIAIADLRPTVINRELEEKLMDYLSFRHLFRNIYGFELKWDRCEKLINNLESTFNDLAKQLEVFKNFLKSL